MKQWKMLSKENVITGNKFLTIEKHKVQAPDGTVINDWQIVITPNFVNIVAVTKEDKFLILKQNKYASDGESLAPVGGYIEPEEDPLVAAKRELQEETGYASDEWIDMGNYIIDSNRGCGKAYLYLAKNIYKVSEPTEIDMELPEILFLTKPEIESAISKNQFKVLPWVTNILFALKQLK